MLHGLALDRALPGAHRGTALAARNAPEEATLPAEILREAGFRTAGVWRNGWVAPNFGFGQGFEVYERPRPGQRSPSFRAENPHISLEGTDLDVIDTAVEFLRVHGRERWFLYVHLMDLHQYLYDENTRPVRFVLLRHLRQLHPARGRCGGGACSPTWWRWACSTGRWW